MQKFKILHQGKCEFLRLKNRVFRFGIPEIEILSKIAEPSVEFKYNLDNFGFESTSDSLKLIVLTYTTFVASGMPHIRRLLLMR